MTRTQILTVFFAFLCIISCSDDNTEELFLYNSDTEITTRALATPYFDWEAADKMPTPPGQPAISVPWIGQGSITSTYGLDVAFDIRKEDGWELLYNTFDSASSSPLVNPYFVLYNKYNGLLRFYLYVTSDFIINSTYIKDALSIISYKQTSLLSFMGSAIVDGNNFFFL